jgi:hypothetical protein
MGAQPRMALKKADENDVFDQLTFRVKPKGLVIDDNPNELVHAITIWIKETMGKSWLPEWEFMRSSNDVTDIDQQVKGKDFILLDHRLEGRFHPFRSGLEIGQRILSIHKDLPIFFYTAGIEDLKEPGTQGKAFGEQFADFKKRPSVRVFDKGDLNPEKRLDDLCYRLVVSDKLQSSIAKDEHKELRLLLESHVESVKPFRYRIVGYDRRKAKQTLRCISEPSIGEIEVPSRYLPKLKLTKLRRDIVLKIVEFSGGQVLSYMVDAPLAKEDLAEEVINFIQGNQK